MNIMNRLRNARFFGSLIIVCCVIAFACGPRPPDEIRIGVLATLSGDAIVIKQSGVPTVNAAKLAAEELNHTGGVEVGGKKYKIALFIEDDHNNPDEAVLAARKLIVVEKVVAMIGPQYSKNAIPVGELAETMRIPMISSISTNPKTTAGKKYVFRVCFIDPFQGRVLAQFAFNTLKAGKAAVLYNIANEYNRGLAEAFKEAFVKFGGQITAYESYTTDVADYRLQLERISAGQPDALLLPNYTSEIIQQAEQARKTGITAVMLFGDGFGISQVSNPALLEGSYQSGHWHPDSTSAESRAFVQAYQQAYGQPAADIDALTYDALGLLMHAMQSQGKTDSEAIRKGLASIKGYRGVSGIIGYQGTGDPVKSAVITQVKDGKSLFYTQVNP